MNIKTLSIIFVCTIAATSSLITCRDFTVDSINQKVSNMNTLVPQLITSADIGTTGYVITKPGVYALASDVVFNPATPAPGTVVAAITIASSNVNLLLGNHRLSQTGAGSPNQTPYAIGILIPDIIPTDPITAIGLESIYISGDQAIIDGFSMYGVRVFGHVYDIKLSNLTIKNCGLLASKAIRSQNNALVNYFPQGVPGTAGPNPLGIAGLCIGESDIFGMGSTFFTQKSNLEQNHVTAVVLDNVSCLSNFFMGLCIANSSDVTINNCHFDDTFCDDPNLYVAGGAFGPANTDPEYPSLQQLVVTNSTFNNSAFNGDFTTSAPGYINNFVQGALLCRSSNIVFDKCHFDNTVATFPGSSVTGFLIIALLDATISDCSFDGTKGLTSSVGCHVSGFNFHSTNAISSQSITFRNCTANNIRQTGDQRIPNVIYDSNVFPSAVGFELFFANSMYLDNCTSEDVVCSGPAGTNAVAAGFFLASGSDIASANFESDDILLRNCIASQIISVRGGNAAGFFLNNFFGRLRIVSLDNCMAYGCQSSILVTPILGVEQGAAMGYWYAQSGTADNGTPVSYTNCKAMYNQGAATVANLGSLGTLYSAGFFASNSSTGATFSHNYTNCEAMSNVYGFLLSNVSVFALRNCRSDGNFLVANASIGEGFTDLGSPAATPAAVGPSSSLFEGNSAFGNGDAVLTTFFGPNRNYNIQTTGGFTPPILEVPLANPAGYLAINPVTYFAGVHNISAVQ